MKRQNNKKAFTLIELLVVIVIIGILATAGINLYSNQMDSARDSNRVTDLKNLQSAVEQYYIDSGYYIPHNNTFVSKITPYLASDELPVDKKHNQADCGNSKCAYAYMANDDTNTPDGYEVSVAFENAGSLNRYKDNLVGGASDDDIDRQEVGNSGTSIDTKVGDTENITDSVAASNNERIVISGTGSIAK